MVTKAWRPPNQNNEGSDSDNKKKARALTCTQSTHARTTVAWTLPAIPPVGVIMKARNCARRKSGDSAYLQVHAPTGKCNLNKQLANNGAANNTQQQSLSEPLRSGSAICLQFM